MRVRGFHIFSIVFAVLSTVQPVLAQCAFDVNAPIDDLQTLDWQISVDGLVNSDLSGSQGICAVQLHFRHSYVGDLTIQLISPSGQVVELVGAVTDQISPTNLTTWDVRFLQCGFPASPDPGFSAQWNNNQAWAVLSLYNGSYYPASGCLEDFNTGSANGIWHIVVIDHDSPQTGELLDVTLIFCDDTGLECNVCGADAGTFIPSVYAICEGTNVNIVPTYPDTIPSPQEYGYVYMISADQTTVSFVPSVPTGNLGAGYYTICGLSFSRADSLELFSQLETLTLDEIQMLFSSGIMACADLTQNCVGLEVSAEIDTTYINRQLCTGEFLVIDGNVYNATGVYTIDIAVPGACDSIVVLDLTVNTVVARIVQQDTISCDNPTTTLDGSSSTAGPGAVYSWTTLNGVILGPSNQQTVSINGAGSYTLTIQYNGCISQKTQVVVGDGSIPFISVKSGTLTCKSPTYTFNTVVFPTDVSAMWNGPGGFVSNQLRPTVSVPGQYFLLVADPDGCSSSVAVTVAIDTMTVKPEIEYSIDCVGQRTLLIARPGNLEYQDKFTWTGPGGFTSNVAGIFATVPGTYCVTLTPSNGCASSTCIDVQSDYTIPDVIATSDSDTLHCGQGVTLMANSSVAGVSYAWSGPAGAFASTQQVMVVSSGQYQVNVTSPNGCMNRDTVVIVTGTDVFQADVFGDTLSCAIDTGVIGVILADPSATYVWAGPGIVDTFDGFTRVTMTGSYQVSVTVGGCTRVLQVSVNGDYVPPNFAPITDTITCSDPIANLSIFASSPYSGITWTLPDGSVDHNAVLNTTLTGDFALTLIRDNGCERTQFTQVMADTTGPAIFLASELLGCDSIPINVIATDSVVAYDWSGPGGFSSQSNSPIVDVPGYYLLTVTGLNGCSTTAIHFVDTNRVLPNIQITAEELDCIDSIALLLLSSTDSMATFSWYGNNQMLTDSGLLQVNLPGMYIGIVKGENACIAMDTVTVLPPNIPTLSIINDTITCFSDATLSATSDDIAAIYEWIDAFGVQSQGSMFSTSTPGSAALTVTGGNGCTHDTTFVIEIDSVAPLAVASSSETVLCDVQTISLSGTASMGQDLSYAWTTSNGLIVSGAASDSVRIMGEGTYILLVTDGSNGCTNTDTLVVTEGQSILGPIYLTVIPECESNGNGSITIDSVAGAAGMLSFLVNGEAASSTSEHLSSGDYAIIVRDSFGCKIDTVINIFNTNSTSSINLGEDKSILVGDSVILEAAVNLDPDDILSIVWTQPVACDSCLTNSVAPLHTQSYSIALEDRFGCIATDEVIVYVDERPKYFIPNVFSPNGDGANDVLTVSLHPGIRTVHDFRVFDRWGNVMFRAQGFDQADLVAWDGTYGGKILDPAVFVYVIEVELLTGRTVIEHGTITLIR